MRISGLLVGSLLVLSACGNGVEQGQSILKATSPDGTRLVVVQTVQSEDVESVMQVVVRDDDGERVASQFELSDVPRAGDCRSFWRDGDIFELICTIGGMERLFAIDIG